MSKNRKCWWITNEKPYRSLVSLKKYSNICIPTKSCMCMHTELFLWLDFLVLGAKTRIPIREMLWCTTIKAHSGDLGNCNGTMEPLGSRWNFNLASDWAKCPCRVSKHLFWKYMWHYSKFVQIKPPLGYNSIFLYWEMYCKQFYAIK